MIAFQMPVWCAGLFTVLRVSVALVFFALAVLFVYAMIKKTVNIGNIFGLCVSAVIVASMIKIDYVRDMLFSANAAGKITAYTVLLLFVLGVILAVMLSFLMIFAAKEREDEYPEVVLVLGCRVRGTKPSRMLERRIEKAYGFLETNVDTYCIACGGKGRGEDISEARSIADELIKRGIDSSRIILEEKSETTVQNMKNAIKIVAENNFGKNAVIVTNEFHQYRAKMIAADCSFYPIVCTVKTTFWLLPTYWVREWFAICSYFVFK